MGPPDDIRLSFNEVADVYDRVRPSYPAALFDALFDMLSPEPEIVEVGPGTGQATKDLLARGASVHAIEIGPAMAARLHSRNQTYSAADYRQLMLSYSVTQMMEESDRRPLLDDMETFIRSDFGGVVTRPLVVTLTTATLT